MSSNPIRDLNQIYLNEVSADAALRASKKADVERGKAAAGGDKEKAKAKAAQASRLYKASAEKRKSEPAKQPDRSYPKGKGATYKEDYETQKKKEVLSAMKRQGRKLSDKDKDKIANKVVASKGDTSKSDDRYAYEEVQNEGLLVKAAGAVEKTAGAINRADKKAFSAIQRGAGKVAKGAAKVVGKGVKKVASATVRGAAGAVSGAVKGAAKGVKKGLSEEQLELQNIRALVEKEVKVKDTRRTVDAIRAYDKSKDASRDATWDTEHGKIKQGDIEKKYAAKERGEIDKDDPNWKKRKYHTGIHGEEVEALVASGKFSNEELVKITNLQEADIADIIARLERKRISKGGDPDESPLGKETGRAMKSQQDKARKKAGLKTEHHQKDADGNVIPHEEIDEGIGKAISRKVKKTKRIIKRMGDAWDDDPGRAHTIGTLGNPNARNEDERARQRKNQRKSK